MAFPYDREWEFLLLKVTFGTSTEYPSRELLTLLEPEDRVSFTEELNQPATLELPVAVTAMPDYSRADFRRGLGLEIVVKYRGRIMFSGPLTGWETSGSNIVTLKAYSDLKYLEWVYPTRSGYNLSTGDTQNVPLHLCWMNIMLRGTSWDTAVSADGLSRTYNLADLGAFAGFHMAGIGAIWQRGESWFDADRRATSPGQATRAYQNHTGFGTATSDRLNMQPGIASRGEPILDLRDENFLEMLQRYSDRSPDWRFDFRSTRVAGPRFPVEELSVPTLIIGQWKHFRDPDSSSSVRIRPTIGLDRSEQITISEEDLMSAFSVTTSLEPPNFSNAVRAVGQGAGDVTTVQRAYRLGNSFSLSDTIPAAKRDSRIWHDAFVGTGGVPDAAYYRANGLRMSRFNAPDIAQGEVTGDKSAGDGLQISDIAEGRLLDRKDPWIAPDNDLIVKMASDLSPSGFQISDFSAGDMVSLDFDVGAVRRAGTDKARIRRITYRIGQITTAELSFGPLETRLGSVG